MQICQPQEQRSFVLTANEALVGTLMTIGDVNNVFPILIKKIIDVAMGGNGKLLSAATRGPDGI